MKDGFISFLTWEDVDSFSVKDRVKSLTPEDIALITTHTKDIIHTWICRYIEMYDPGYTFDEIVGSIKITYVSDGFVKFKIFDPHNRIYENFEIPRSFLEDIKEETRRLVGKVLYKNSSPEATITCLTPQIYGIIKSWIPDINPKKIIGVNTLSRVKNGLRFDYLKVYFRAENGNINDEYIPHIFKWEFYATQYYLGRMLLIDRENILYRLTWKWKK
ncbi:MAG: hypothetical protein ACD_78C00201G0008 [uncultured bacterium (gcode 4)]|uniref:Uncharacterized protein n=1 Tax=uncultured bacterium (gcode 4) TaxID=1234023 RepID=K1YCB1_9BACT|nr:MAG: hypothetical protein ACD_78C00201G0008 [uncultured bacterium (gcode 4)]